MLDAPNLKASIHNHRTMLNHNQVKDLAGRRAHAKPAGCLAHVARIPATRPDGLKRRYTQDHPANHLSSGKNLEVATQRPCRPNRQHFTRGEAKRTSCVRRTPCARSFFEFRFEIEG